MLFFILLSLDWHSFDEFFILTPWLSPYYILEAIYKPRCFYLKYQKSPVKMCLNNKRELFGSHDANSTAGGRALCTVGFGPLELFNSCVSQMSNPYGTKMTVGVHTYVCTAHPLEQGCKSSY